MLSKFRAWWVIPWGRYCHSDGFTRVCPHWSLREDLPEQENGYCTYLGKSDWDINEEAQPIEVTHYKDGKETHRTLEDAHIYTVGLLWDKCKECQTKLRE